MESLRPPYLQAAGHPCDRADESRRRASEEMATCAVDAVGDGDHTAPAGDATSNFNNAGAVVGTSRRLRSTGSVIASAASATPAATVHASRAERNQVNAVVRVTSVTDAVNASSISRRASF